MRHHASVDLEIRLANRGIAKRVVKGRRDESADPPWAAGYPLDGDQKACAAYVGQLGIGGGGSKSVPFGYYQILEGGVVVGGIGFHGPPRDGLVEVGYGVVPSVRGRGVATTALRLLLQVACDQGGVHRVCGRTSEDNVASQKVMLGVGMELVGRDPDFLHYEMELAK
jgi:RimJ/RimL family protein N-acetyltransferase